MNHQGLRWNVHCVANVALRIRLNLYKRGFKIYDLLVAKYAQRQLSHLHGVRNIQASNPHTPPVRYTFPTFSLQDSSVLLHKCLLPFRQLWDGLR